MVITHASSTPDSTRLKTLFISHQPTTVVIVRSIADRHCRQHGMRALLAWLLHLPCFLISLHFFLCPQCPCVEQLRSSISTPTEWSASSPVDMWRPVRPEQSSPTYLGFDLQH